MTLGVLLRGATGLQLKHAQAITSNDWIAAGVAVLLQLKHAQAITDFHLEGPDVTIRCNSSTLKR